MSSIVEFTKNAQALFVEKGLQFTFTVRNLSLEYIGRYGGDLGGQELKVVLRKMGAFVAHLRDQGYVIAIAEEYIPGTKRLVSVNKVVLDISSYRTRQSRNFTTRKPRRVNKNKVDVAMVPIVKISTEHVAVHQVKFDATVQEISNQIHDLMNRVRNETLESVSDEEFNNEALRRLTARKK